MFSSFQTYSCFIDRVCNSISKSTQEMIFMMPRKNFLELALVVMKKFAILIPLSGRTHPAVLVVALVYFLHSMMMNRVGCTHHL